MRPPIQDNVKRVNAITSLRSGHLIDHNLEDLVDVPVEFSPSLSPPSLTDSASKDATDNTPIDPSPSNLLTSLTLRRLSKMSLRRERIHHNLQLSSEFISLLHPFRID